MSRHGATGRELNRAKILSDTVGCSSGKRAYCTEGEALHSLEINKHIDHPTEANKPGAYQCNACRHWHVSATMRRTRRAEMDARRNGRRHR